MIEKLKEKYIRLPVQARASFWFMICSVLQRGLSVITTPIFTRILTTTEYGEFGTYVSWQQIINVIITMNLGSGVLMRGIVRNEDRKDEFMSALLGLSTFLIAAWFSIYLMFQDFWNDLFKLPSAQMIAMFATAWAGIGFTFWKTGQRVDYKYKKMVTVTLIVSAVRPIVAYLIIISTQNRITNRIIGDTVVSVLAYTYFTCLIIKRGRTLFNREFWKYAFWFNLPLIPHYLSQVVLNSSDRLMIKYLVGLDKAGIYTLAYMLSTILGIVNSSINSTMEPWLYRKIRDGNPQGISKVVYPLFGLIAGVNFFLICFAPEAIAFFAPPAYHEAIWIVPPVAMSMYFSFTYVFFAAFEFYYKKTYLVTIATLTGAAANIGLNLLFIPKYGYYAAGYTTLVCYMLFSIMHYIFMRKIVKDNGNAEGVYPLKGYVLLSLTVLILGLLLALTYRNTLVRYGVIAVMLLITYLNRKRVMAIVNSVLQAKQAKPAGQ